MGKQSTGGGRKDAADCIAQDAKNKQNNHLCVGFFKGHHQDRSQNDHPAFQIVTDIHDMRFVQTVSQYAANRSKKQQGDPAQCQIQTLQECIVSSDLQNVKTDSKTIENRTKFRNQRSEEDQAKVPVGEDITAFLKIIAHSR